MAISKRLAEKAVTLHYITTFHPLLLINFIAENTQILPDPNPLCPTPAPVPLWPQRQLDLAHTEQLYQLIPHSNF